MRHIIAINGPSCSGKTYISNKLKDICPERISVLNYDAYCVDHGPLTPEEIKKINYDVPEAYDGALLNKHVRMLKEGKSIEIPVYDFATHRRKNETIHFESNDIIIVEGIMVFQVKELMDDNIYDFKVAVDGSVDTRYQRRFTRDQIERGRTPESIKYQWDTTVQPSCELYIDPLKDEADLIIINNKNNNEIEDFDLLMDKIREYLSL